MYKLDNFKSCCDYLGIDNTLPVCQIDERQIQAAYKLRVCMKAWNKQDSLELDEKASFYQEKVGFTPYFLLRDGKLMSSGAATNGSYAGIVFAYAANADSYTSAYIGLRQCFTTRNRAVEFGKTFIDIFNELI